MRNLVASVIVAVCVLTVAAPKAQAQTGCQDCALFGPGFFCFDNAVVGWSSCYAYVGSGSTYCLVSDPCEYGLDLRRPSDRKAMGVARAINLAARSVIGVDAARACRIAGLLLQNAPRSVVAAEPAQRGSADVVALRIDQS